MNKQQFIELVKRDCELNNVVFQIENSNTIKTLVIGTECSGFFEENPKIKTTLGVANDLEEQDFFEVLTHEYCHMQQWKEKSNLWKKRLLSKKEIEFYSKDLKKDCSGFEAADIYYLWIDNELELDEKTLDNLLERSTLIELDCESRVLKMIDKYNLPIIKEDYAQKANAYLLSYFFARHFRKWPKKGLYLIPEIYKEMPKVIEHDIKNYLDNKMIGLINSLAMKE